MAQDDRPEIWGTPFRAWQWAEILGLLCLVAAVRLDDRFDERTPRLVAAFVALALFVHILIWFVPVLRRRL
jgi:hypothetical protein